MKILIISPHFPPTNAADMQRVRLILPYLKEAGAKADVLAVEPCQVASPHDPWLLSGVPSDVPIHRVKALGLGWSRIPGLGLLSSRAMGALHRRGDEILQSGRFDLVYFSTTQFRIHVLGPYWKKRHGVPFVMDYQDPWVSDYYREHPEVTPPGGRLKYAITNWISRRDEPRVLKECSGVTSVSPDYPIQLENRYDFLKVEKWEPSAFLGARKTTEDSPDGATACREASGVNSVPTLASRASLNQVSSSRFQVSKVLPSFVIPFPGDDRDFERIRAEGITQRIFDPKDGLRHWLYIGAGGPYMATASRSLFKAIKQYGERGDNKPETANLKPERNPGEEEKKDCGLRTRDGGGSDFLKKLRIHFIGTSYAGAGRGVKSIEPIAIEEGLGGIVTEHTDRIPYSETLRCLLDADALVVPGSNDPGYTASKIYPYLLAGKPLLTVFQEKSSVVSLIRSIGGGVVIPFAAGEGTESIAERIRAEWLVNHQYEQAVPLARESFAPYTASAQAGQLAEFFRSVLKEAS
jgi:hypothetical protein